MDLYILSLYLTLFTSKILTANINQYGKREEELLGAVDRDYRDRKRICSYAGQHPQNKRRYSHVRFIRYGDGGFYKPEIISV